jgi:hypothetical protein
MEKTTILTVLHIGVDMFTFYDDFNHSFQPHAIH